MTTARAFISSWVVPQLSSGSKRNNLGFGKLGFMRRASPCPYPRATLARSIITWWRSPAGRFNCYPQSLPLDIIMGALSNGAGTTETWHESKEHVVDLTEFALEGAKITSVAHGVWRRVVKPGDTVVDATCGNGHDTLVLTNMVCIPEVLGSVYALDVQEDALANTSYLLDHKLDELQRKQVHLLQLCHSQLEKVVSNLPVRLVAFNLGYLPGGDKQLKTGAETTLRALKAASNVLQAGGLISVVAYTGHPGGLEEYETVKQFGASLPSEAWICSHHEWINRPLSARLVFLLKR
ncbi:unnamed protein product [Sphagnum troendelagicum]